MDLQIGATDSSFMMRHYSSWQLCWKPGKVECKLGMLNLREKRTSIIFCKSWAPAVALLLCFLKFHFKIVKLASLYFAYIYFLVSFTCFCKQHFCSVSSLYIWKTSMAECECLSIVLASFKHVSCFAWLRQIKSIFITV